MGQILYYLITLWLIWIISDFVFFVDSPREIRQGEEIAWYADGETIVRNEHTPATAYAYGMVHYAVFGISESYLRVISN